MPRVLVGELMDDPRLDPVEHARALRGLARLNALSRAGAGFYQPLAGLSRSLDRPLTIVDIATGSADVPVALLRRARRDGLRFEVTACDNSPVALEHARARARAAGVDLATQQLDILEHDPPAADAMLCSLFLHHLSDEDVRLVLGKLAAAARSLVLVSDLRRGAWGNLLAAAVPRLVTRSRVVHVDALRSARAALSMGEARSLTRGIEHGGRWTAGAAFPARMLIAWHRSDTTPS